MKKYLFDYMGSNVKVTMRDNEIFTGRCISYESEADSDNGIANITVTDTKQFGSSYIELLETEIKSIEEIK